MPLELRDSFAFVFVFYPSAKLQSERIFFGKIFVTDRDWNFLILKAIRGLSDSYLDPLQKPKWKHIWNDNWV